ncbi:hypothetical protein CDD80_1915 [Ophiocordyceps camponoti-rufipedis]|uniref:Uncharacterized protein n=1 Tax=Ophiocordyceps camponoti-rufipedis TaxID=2004952 RepID=A0A2C5Z7W7_9HYPO|nr:hypothetical protein CDD80_1915 [Ophiocordyceps camponoti-rufipedis]
MWQTCASRQVERDGTTHWLQLTPEHIDANTNAPGHNAWLARIPLPGRLLGTAERGRADNQDGLVQAPGASKACADTREALLIQGSPSVTRCLLSMPTPEKGMSYTEKEMFLPFDMSGSVDCLVHIIDPNRLLFTLSQAQCPGLQPDEEDKPRRGWTCSLLLGVTLSMVIALTDAVAPVVILSSTATVWRNSTTRRALHAFGRLVRRSVHTGRTLPRRLRL